MALEAPAPVAEAGLPCGRVACRGVDVAEGVGLDAEEAGDVLERPGRVGDVLLEDQQVDLLDREALEVGPELHAVAAAVHEGGVA